MTKPSRQGQARPPSSRRDAIVAAACGAFVAVMVGAALRRCRSTTGSAAPPVSTARRRWRRLRPAMCSTARSPCASTPMSAPDLPWRFTPERNEIDVRLGEVVTVHYNVTNEAARATVGVRPPTTSRRSIGAPTSTRSTASASPSSRWRPARNARCRSCSTSIRHWRRIRTRDQTDTITLSYTFYPLREPARPVAERAGGAPASKL